MEKEKFLSSIYLIIKNDKGQILLYRRKGTKLWPNFLALPAGHVDEGENVFDALKREAKEELDIEVKISDIIDSFVVNRRNKTLNPYFDVYFEIKKYKGIIKINEPDKNGGFIWCSIENLPEDMVKFQKEAIRNNLKNIKFSVIDVDDENDMKKNNK